MHREEAIEEIGKRVRHWSSAGPRDLELERDAQEILEIVRVVDVVRSMELSNDFLGIKKDILGDIFSAGGRIVCDILEAHGWGYEGCHRAMYAANLYDPVSKTVVEGTYTNLPSENLGQFCMWDGSCIRGQFNKPHFASYENCPAVHAAGHFRKMVLPRSSAEKSVSEFMTEDDVVDSVTTYAPHDTMWVEGGVYRSGDGFKNWRIDETSSKPKSALYPCIRCLTHCSRLGIETLAVVWVENEEDTEPIEHVSFHDVETHLAAFIAFEVYNGLMEVEE